MFSPFFLVFLFLFGEKKKEPKKKSSIGVNGQGNRVLFLLKFFWAAFLSRKAAKLPINTTKKASPDWTRPALPSAAHDPTPGTAKRRLNHQPLNQKDRVPLLPMDRAPFSEIIYYFTRPVPICQALFFVFFRPGCLSFSVPGSSGRKADSYRTGASALPRTEAVMMPGEAGCSHHTPGGRVSPCVSVLFPSILRNVNAGDTGTVWSGASGFAILIYRKVSV